MKAALITKDTSFQAWVALNVRRAPANPSAAAPKTRAITWPNHGRPHCHRGATACSSVTVAKPSGSTELGRLITPRPRGYRSDQVWRGVGHGGKAIGPDRFAPGFGDERGPLRTGLPTEDVIREVVGLGRTTPQGRVDKAHPAIEAMWT